MIFPLFCCFYYLLNHIIQFLSNFKLVSSRASSMIDIKDLVEGLTLQSQTHKMVKHTQTIHWLLPTNYLSVFKHFVESAFKGLNRGCLPFDQYRISYNNCWASNNHYTVLQSDKLSVTLTVQKVSASGVFWSVFFCILTEYGQILRMSPYSVQMRENMDQKNSEYGHFSRSASNKRLTSRCVTYQKYYYNILVTRLKQF